jgi:translation initiation factor 4E
MTDVVDGTIAPLVVGAPRQDGKLESSWAIWYDKKSSAKTSTAEFRQRLQKVSSFDSIEGFWKIYLYLKRPSQLENNINLYLFRDHCPAPMWESYPRGGCWILKVKKKTSGASVLGKLWQDLLLALIGEQFEEPDVVGISISIRTNEDLITVWNADNRNEEIKMKIGERLKVILDLELSTVIEYKAHADSMRDLSSFRNTKSFVYAAAASVGL